MSKQNVRESNLVRAIQKFAVSTFVVCSFLVYAAHEHFTTANSALDTPPTPTEPVAQSVPDFSQPTSPAPSNQSAPTTAPTAQPPTRPAPTATPAPKTTNGAYKDGTYTGPSVNAMWGLVQVQVVVQNGQVKDVQALQYPSDRRTSQRINQQALPWLQSEVIQSQNANVDMISGATLTSQAYIRSLQVALNSAKN